MEEIDMFEQFMWQKFLNSGNIYDYLVLKEEADFAVSVNSSKHGESFKNFDSVKDSFVKII